jgi:hypothetical protein
MMIARSSKAMRSRWRLGASMGDVVVAAAEVLHECITDDENPRRAVPLHTPHRPEPGLQPPLVCLDRVVRVLLSSVQGRGDQFVEDPRVTDGFGRDLDRDRAGAHRPGEEAPGGSLWGFKSLPGL